MSVREVGKVGGVAQPVAVPQGRLIALAAMMGMGAVAMGMGAAGMGVVEAARVQAVRVEEAARGMVAVVMEMVAVAMEMGAVVMEMGVQMEAGGEVAMWVVAGAGTSRLPRCPAAAEVGSSLPQEWRGGGEVA